MPKVDATTEFGPRREDEDEDEERIVEGSIVYLVWLHESMRRVLKSINNRNSHD